MPESIRHAALGQELHHSERTAVQKDARTLAGRFKSPAAELK